MPTPQIANPQGAFGYTTLAQKGSLVGTGEFKAEGAIVANTPVSITSTGGIIATSTGGLAIIGVALEAGATGDTVAVLALGGPVSISAGGATTLGTPVIRSATTAGYVTSSATPVTGTVVGFALGASASSLSWVWVNPGSNTSS